MGLEAVEDDLDVLGGERPALDVVAVTGVVQERGVEALEQPVLDHDGLAAPALLGRRPEEDDLAGELVGDRRQGDGGARRPRPPSCCGRSHGRGRAARRTRRGSRCAGRRRRRPPGRTARIAVAKAAGRMLAPRTRDAPGPPRPRPPRGAPRRPAPGRRGSGATARGSRRVPPRRRRPGGPSSSAWGSAGRVVDSDGNGGPPGCGIGWIAPA